VLPQPLGGIQFRSRTSAHILFIFSDSAFRPAAVNPRFFAAFFVAFLPPAFFAAQYRRIAAIWRCRPSADILRFAAFRGLPRRFAAGWLAVADVVLNARKRAAAE
jgi:hypothetical protein